MYLHDWPTMLFMLFVGHALADFALQTDFMARAKNRNTDIGKDHWHVALPAHALIHGGFVMLFTGTPLVALLEVLAHTAIDAIKCEGKISFCTRPNTASWLQSPVGCHGRAHGPRSLTPSLGLQ